MLRIVFFSFSWYDHLKLLLLVNVALLIWHYFLLELQHWHGPILQHWKFVIQVGQFYWWKNCQRNLRIHTWLKILGHSIISSCIKNCFPSKAVGFTCPILTFWKELFENNIVCIISKPETISPFSLKCMFSPAALLNEMSRRNACSCEKGKRIEK